MTCPIAHIVSINLKCSHDENDGKNEQKSLNINKQEAISKCEPVYESQVSAQTHI